mmetsp:Transcript_89974/g.165145  ORF Transcript_89974/g.165145 Transcript_89974/m.165145 type:complete len:356 (-) Transcript_89974:59-1126(-)
MGLCSLAPARLPNAFHGSRLLLYLLWLTLSCAHPRVEDDETCLLQTKMQFTKNEVNKVVAKKVARVSFPAEMGPPCKPAQTSVLESLGGVSMLSSNLSLSSSREPSAVKLALHESRKAELEALSAKGIEFIFYGDSITEQWRETGGGFPCRNLSIFTQICDGNMETFDQHFGPSAIMGVGGDTTADLLWRLENGEAPLQQPRAILLHIGINNLNKEPGFFKFLNPRGMSVFSADEVPFHGEEYKRLADTVYFNIEAVVRKLLMVCQVPIVLTALFPTGFLWPAGPYGKTIPRVNALLNDLASHNAQRLRVIDCSTAVLNTSSNKIDPVLMPDFLHPSPQGMERWAECMSRALQSI